MSEYIGGKASLELGEKEPFSADDVRVHEHARASPGQRHWPCTDRGDRSGAGRKRGVLRGGEPYVVHAGAPGGK